MLKTLSFILYLRTLEIYLTTFSTSIFGFSSCVVIGEVKSTSQVSLEIFGIRLGRVWISKKKHHAIWMCRMLYSMLQKFLAFQGQLQTIITS